jgi:two-component system, sensor histidine kinase and response regulator
MENNLHVDPKQIQHLHELGGSTLVIKMIGLFLENAPLRVKEIHQAEEQNNWEGIFQAVHKLKSSSGNFGAHSLFELCGKIEAQIRGKQTHGLTPHLRELERLLECVLAVLQQEKERMEE